MAGFRGRIFATPSTIAVMRLLLQDFARLQTLVDAATDDREGGYLYDEADLARCLEKMEPVDFFERKDIGRGAIMTFSPAGHVLGAAMVLLEIAGVKLLYTGDYSTEEDRHLPAARPPPGLKRPDVLICEATYGLKVHDKREDRERAFTDAVEKVVRRGGKCLIPMQALGRGQELALILEELWAAKPELQRVPIYFPSRMASQSLEVYQTFVGAMNAGVQRAVAAGASPWRFRFVKTTAPRDLADAPGPCVVMAAPGMLQKGLSRTLFEAWAEDAANGVVLAGYAVANTLARTLEEHPTTVPHSNGKRVLARKCEVFHASFSAHVDYPQTSAFVAALRPAAIVLVHGEAEGMKRLCDALRRQYAGSAGWWGAYMPANNSLVEFMYGEKKVARLAGAMAEAAGAGRVGAVLSGVLVARDFETLLLAPSELARFTQLSTHTLAQKVHVPFRCSFGLLEDFVQGMYSGCEAVGGEGVGGEPRALRVAGGLVTLTHVPPDRVVVMWEASPQADTVADSLVAVISQLGVARAAVAASTRPCAHAHHHPGSGQGGAGEGAGEGAGGSGDGSGGGGGGASTQHSEGCAHAHGGAEGPACKMTAAESAWAAAAHWSRELLSNDGACLSGGPCGAVARRARYARELLERQFGAGAVAETGAGALTVALDGGAVGSVAWGGEGGVAAAVEVRGGELTQTQRTQWEASLAESARAVDALCRPLL
jgi:cleavage and polyadenylation specificity factor subunit 3